MNWWVEGLDHVLAVTDGVRVPLSGADSTSLTALHHPPPAKKKIAATGARLESPRGSQGRRACTGAEVPAVSPARPPFAELWEQHGAVHDVG